MSNKYDSLVLKKRFLHVLFLIGQIVYNSSSDICAAANPRFTWMLCDKKLLELKTAVELEEQHTLRYIITGN